MAHIGSGLGIGIGIGAWGFPFAYAYSRHGGGSYGRYSSLSDRDRRGRAHARLRIVGAPRNAGVIIDGQYVGVVDDFDGVFQHLELIPGPHHVEIRAPGLTAITFDVNAQGRRTITYRAQVPPAHP